MGLLHYVNSESVYTSESHSNWEYYSIHSKAEFQIIQFWTSSGRYDEIDNNRKLFRAAMRIQFRLSEIDR